MSTAHVGNLGAGSQLGLNPIERGDPGTHEVSRVVRSEEALRPFEQVGIVLVPSYSVAGPESLGDSRLILD
jgi:hypothetical protein